MSLLISHNVKRPTYIDKNQTFTHITLSNYFVPIFQNAAWSVCVSLVQDVLFFRILSSNYSFPTLASADVKGRLPPKSNSLLL